MSLPIGALLLVASVLTSGTSSVGNASAFPDEDLSKELTTEGKRDALEEVSFPTSREGEEKPEDHKEGQTLALKSDECPALGSVLAKLLAPSFMCNRRLEGMFPHSHRVFLSSLRDISTSALPDEGIWIKPPKGGKQNTVGEDEQDPVSFPTPREELKLQQEKIGDFHWAKEEKCFTLKSMSEACSEIGPILCDVLISSYGFSKIPKELMFMFEEGLDIMEPNAPEDMYKTQMEKYASPLLHLVRDHQLESARQNLTLTLFNGFVNAGVCSDTLVSTSDGQDCLHRNKDHAMMSATAYLGLINLWNIEGGLSFIDRYSDNNNNFIKSGLLMAVGLISCGVRSEYDAAKAYISEYLPLESQIVQVGAVLGLGLAYAGSQRSDIIDLLLSILKDTILRPEVTAITAVSCSLICVGSASPDVVLSLVTLLQSCTEDELKNCYMRFLPLALGLLYLGSYTGGRKENIEPACVSLDALPELLNSVAHLVLQMYAYAGTGDVLVIQEMFHHCTPIDKARVDREQNTSPVNENVVRDANDSEDGCSEKFSLRKTVATLAIGVIAGDEEIGSDMCHRLFIQMARYGNAIVKKAVMLITAMTSISDPEITLLDVMKEFSHNSNVGVACSAIFVMGLIRTGTNNARFAAILRQLAIYYANNPNVLFMVRISQVLLSMSKVCFTLSPYQVDGQGMIPVALAGQLVVIFSFLNNNNVILGTSHYFLYYLAAAIQPRWLITLDENLKSVFLPVRVGQGVCTVGKAGVPNRITGFQTHDTPVLLAVGERAELSSDTYKLLTDILEGCVILRRNNKN